MPGPREADLRSETARQESVAAPAEPARKGAPTAALVAFWLVVILLLAAGLAVASTVAGGRTSAVAQPVPAAQQLVVAAATLPAGHRLADAPRGDAVSHETGGVVLLGATPAATPTAPPETPTPQVTALPSEVLLQDVPVGKQTRSLNCEFQTASDLAWYYGRPVTWEEIYQYVGHDTGGNPHVGFVGRSFDDKPGQIFPQGYGVYAEPIAGAFEKLGLQAQVFYGQSPEWVKAQLAAGRPVMVWTTSGMTVRPVATWTADGGVEVKGVPGEHTYLTVGYNASGVWVIDPYDGRRHHFAWATFQASWDLLDRMAVVVMDEPKITRPTPVS